MSTEFSKIDNGAVLFDLDGTLLDTAPDFVHVVNTLLAENNRPPLPFDVIRNTVSNGARALITLAFELEESHPDFEPLRERLLALYTEQLAVETKPFNGIKETLAYLADFNIPWGIVTNKPSIYTDKLLQRIALTPAAGTVICPDHVSRSKPDPEPLLLACQQLTCSPSKSIYIGDHRRDIEAGKNANMTTIAAAYGYVHRDDPAESWQADHCIYSALEIIDIIRAKLHNK